LREFCDGAPVEYDEIFHCLHSAGVIIGDWAAAARRHCRLYAAYLQRHLK